MSSISATVLTKDEEDNIVRCLSSLAFCDEVLLIDHSSDETLKLAKNVAGKKLRVIKNSSDHFADLRNLGLKEAAHDWVLFIDADEEVSPELAQEIIEKIQASNIKGYVITRQDYFLGKWLNYGETSQVKLLKLGRKNAGIWKRRVHEVWDVGKEVHILKNPLYHFPHPSVAEFIQRINRWTDMDAQEFFEQGKRVSWWQIVAYPKAKFILNYILRQGFRDGMPGLIMALMMSFHSFLTRAKLYQLSREPH